MTLTATQQSHLDSLVELTLPGGPIDVDAPTATHRQPQNLLGGNLSAARARVRKDLLRAFVSEKDDVLEDRRAVILVGPPGAGKSSARRRSVPKDEEKHWRFIDPDDFKTRLLRHARSSGEYDMLVPSEVRERIAAGERFAPGEFAALVHQESSDLAKIAARHAIDRGERIVLDGIHGTPAKILARIKTLADAGYSTLQVIGVDGSRTVTRARVVIRWATAYARYETADDDHESGYEARYVPEHITADLYPDDERFSTCAGAITRAVATALDGLTIEANLFYVEGPASAGIPWRTHKREASGRATFHQHLHLPAPRPVAPAPVDPTGHTQPLSDGIRVAGYTRHDGSPVPPHTRRRPTPNTQP